LQLAELLFLGAAPPFLLRVLAPVRLALFEVGQPLPKRRDF